MAQYYRSAFNTQVADGGGIARRIATTNAFNIAVENMVGSRTTEGVASALWDYDRFYSVGAFDWEAFADDATTQSASAGFSPLNRVWPAVETGYSARACTINIGNGDTITFTAVSGPRTFNVPAPGAGDAVKVTRSVQITGAITFTFA